MLSGTGMTNAAPTIFPYDDTTSVMLNDFPLYHESGREIRSREQNRPAQGEFDFDPVSPPSKHSLVKMGEVEMMNNWHGFEKHAEHGNLRYPPAGLPSSFSTSNLPGAPAGEGGDLSTVPTNPSLHSGTVSPTELTAPTTSASSPTLPPLRKKGRPRLGNLNEPTNLGRASEGMKRKRRRKWSGDSASAGTQSPESETRRVFLEKNRRAAAKSREKKRNEIHELKKVSRAAAAENSRLKKQTMQMQEEILSLGSKLFAHVDAVS